MREIIINKIVTFIIGAVLIASIWIIGACNESPGAQEIEPTKLYLVTYLGLETLDECEYLNRDMIKFEIKQSAHDDYFFASYSYNQNDELFSYALVGIDSSYYEFETVYDFEALIEGSEYEIMIGEREKGFYYLKRK